MSLCSGLHSTVTRTQNFYRGIHILSKKDIIQRCVKMKLTIVEFVLLLILLESSISNVLCSDSITGISTWESASNGAIPDQAVVAGYEADGRLIYVARANYQGGLIPGKIQSGFGGAHIAWGGDEIAVTDYEVLCGGTYISWKPASDGNIPDCATEAGYEADGRPVYIARANYQGGLIPGKIQSGFGGAHIAWGGKEIAITDYEVLCGRAV